MRDYKNIGAILWPENYTPNDENDISEVVSDTPKIDRLRIMKLINELETKSSKQIKE